MAGFGDAVFNDIVQEYVYESVGLYIIICCEEMKSDLSNNEKLPNNENKIRNHLLELYLDNDLSRKKHKMDMFRFVPEVSENFNKDVLTYEGRVDIKIVHQIHWFENRDASFFVECKRLDGTKHLNEEYVINGVKRFVVDPPHYNSFYNKNFMLGIIVRSVEMDVNVKRIELIQQADNEVDNIGGLICISSGATCTYDSMYRLNDTTIELRHIFADFSRVIS